MAGSVTPIGTRLAPRCHETLHGQRCTLDWGHNGDHNNGHESWPRDILTYTKAVTIGQVELDVPPDSGSEIYGSWWLSRADGDPIWDEFSFISGGSDEEPDWSAVESEVGSYLADSDSPDRVLTFVAERIRIDAGRLRADRAYLTVAAQDGA